MTRSHQGDNRRLAPLGFDGLAVEMDGDRVTGRAEARHRPAYHALLALRKGESG
jgi:hypothetical protein